MEIKANIIVDSCQISLNNNKSVILDSVGYDYFADNITPEDDYAGGEMFYVTINNCPGSDSKNPKKLTLSFTPLSGSLSPYSNQIFTNDDETGAQNVGIVIFSVQDPNNRFNVLKSDGSPQSIYAVSSADDLTEKNYTFYTRMQRENNARSVTGGPVRTSVWISAYYE
ncbi:fimbrial-like protein [Superficieibacter sp. HKU1]|uniref:fimbrial-like protein n=1 Tax=Superficieibacter sp. HKU1 TaxID=3031919 RepID=UPI0023E0E47C|nr:fimbrial-like protein [Superficieibacter sp. HKU1]